MNGKFFKNLMSKGKSLIPSFSKPPIEINDICEGLMKFPNKSDSMKLKDINPYFAPVRIEESQNFPSVILLVVGFHHKKGSIIEYAYPESVKTALQTTEYEELSRKICFVAIPDAIHTLEVVLLYNYRAIMHFLYYTSKVKYGLE